MCASIVNNPTSTRWGIKSLLIPVAVHDRWCDIVSLRKRAVLPVDGASHGTVSLRNRAGRPVDGASWSVEILSPEAAVGEGVVLALARNTGIISEMFAKFCREHLCMESWNFIADIVRYEGVSTAAMQVDTRQQIALA